MDDGLMTLSDHVIEEALEHHCDRCGMGIGVECVCVISGLWLIEVDGVPVHDERVGDQ